MNESDVYDLSNLLQYQQRLVAMRNTASVLGRQAPEQDREMWKGVYRRAIREIASLEGEIGAMLPSKSYDRSDGAKKP